MLSKSLLKKFRAVLGADHVLDDATDRLAHSFDASAVTPVSPSLVVRPGTNEQLRECIVLCHEHRLPITVRGAGTNLSGGTIPLPEGVVIHTGRLDRIIEINKADLYAVVEPGVVTAKLAAAAASQGLFYPPDPGSQAVSTLGGNVAENAGGLRCLKYGVTKDYVMGISFFDSAGRSIKAGSRTVKCVTGLDLASLMVGSEGTLGVIYEITLKLIAPPAASRTLTATFDSVGEASATVAAIISAPILPCSLEYMDNFTLRAVEDFAHIGLPVERAAMLLIEVDGHPAQVAEEAEQIQKICARHGALEIESARTDSERDHLWQARRAALSALARIKPTIVQEDVTVPRSRLPELVEGLEEIAHRHNLTIGTFGHAGDGNLHPTILTDKRDRDEWTRVESAIDDIFALGLRLGGTLSGEHGIGLAKAKYLVDEIGQATIDFSDSLQRAADPNGILRRVPRTDQ